ncbi:hypothetical protein nbrc107697_23680 [Gordonia crocea]|uniref:Nuclease associated modular domain-containing protein n=1 Tax=Gordonia crocea TaxID=589162 RepID=A0A7I9UZM6_9ACTN|nr:hypothetical protein nbrc107697_23680 [Gordonia crocea]
MAASREDKGGVVYGIRLRDSCDYRYVGQTSLSAPVRLRKHFQVAASGRKTPFYDWLRKQDRSDVIVDVLDCCGTRDDLGETETAWIAYLRFEGQPLLNLSGGGLGPSGIEWTAEMREAARVRSTGRPGIHRYGPEAPFYGHSHTPEQRAKWVDERKGTNSGAANPNFGKFGAEHPSYGHTVSDETRAKLSEQKRGERNPNYGKKASAETRAKMSAVRKGRPMPSSRRSAHTRHHTNKVW